MKEITGEQFKQIAEAIPQIVWTALPNGEIIYVSKQAIEYTGVKQEEQLGSAWLDLLHPDDRDRVQNQWMEAVRGKVVYDIEYRIRRHNGEYRWMKVRATPIRDSNGEVTNWFGSCTDIDDFKQAQIQYEKNIDISPALLWSTDPSGLNIYLNKQWQDVTGQSPDEGQGLGWLEVIHPNDRKRLINRFQEAVENHEHFRLEYRIRQKDGSYRWAVDSGNPRFDQEGNYQGHSGVVFDIQEQKDATEILENFWSLPGNMLAISDMKSEYFLKLSPAWEDTLGYTLEEIISRPWLSFVHPDDLDVTLLQGQKLATGEKLLGFENRYRKKNGEWVWLSWTVYPVEGKLYCRVADITEQKIANQKLEASEKRFRFYTEAMPQMVFIADPRGNIIYYNKRHYEYFGIEPQDEEKWKWTEQQVQHPDDLNRTIVTWQNSLRTGQPYQIEYRLKRHDGVYRWHLGQAIPIRNEEGQVREWVGTNTDIHDAKMASEELKELTNKLKNSINARDEFISIASHELKTPITSIKLRNQMQLRALEMGSPTAMEPDKIKALAIDTDTHISRLSRLVDDMLDVSKIRLGQFTLNKERLRMSDLVEHVIKYMTPQFLENNFPLPFIHIFQDAEGEWDRIRIEQILQNILANSLKYAGGKNIVITIDVKDQFVNVAIKDQGPGVSPELHERIFERYERGVKASEISGMGLGLFISQQLAIAHHGEITLESKQGEGCNFILSLPIK